MAVPVFAPVTDSPVKIDPSIKYEITIAAQGADTVSWQPNPNFAIARTVYSGTPSTHTFDVTFTGNIPSSATVFQIVFIASNSSGAVNQTWNIEVSPASVTTTTVKKTASITLHYNSNVSDIDVSGAPAGWYKVGDAVLVGPLDSQSGSPLQRSDTNANVIGQILYVQYVSGSTIRLAATSGGSALSFYSSATGGHIEGMVSFPLWVGFATSGSTYYHVGDSSALSNNDLIRAVYSRSDGPIIPLAVSGNLFVVDLSDAYHIKVSATANGSPIAAASNSLLAYNYPDPVAAGDTRPLLQISALRRVQRYPLILLNSQVDEDDVANGAILNSTVGSASGAGAVDSFFAYNLPPGSVFTDNALTTHQCTLTGTLAAGANDTYYPILVVAIKGSYQTKKYYIIKVGTGATLGGSGAGGSIPVITAAGPITAVQGSQFSFQPSATNSPSSWSVGAAPAGLTFDPVTGILSGAFSASGTFSLQFTAFNSAGASVPVTIIFNVSASVGGVPAPTPTPTLAPSAPVIGDPTAYDPSVVARSRNVSLVLLIDEEQKLLAGNLFSQALKTLPAFFEGDQLAADIYFLYPTGNIFSPYSLKSFTADPAIRLGLGKVQFPTGGTFTVTFGANTTAALAYNITAAALQTALEGLASIGSGNIAVTGDYQSGFALEFKGSLGLSNVAQVTVSASALTPFSAALVRTARGGTGSVNEVQEIRLGQLVAAYQANWTPIYAAGTVTPSTVTGGGSVSEVQKLLFGKRPIGGTYTITLDSVTTDPISVFATRAEIQSIIDLALGLNIATVSLTTGPAPYLTITWIDTANHTQHTVDSTNVIWSYGYTASVSVDTVGIDQLVGPLGSITDALLEIELTPSGGTPETFIQQTATIKSDLLKTGLLGSP